MATQARCSTHMSMDWEWHAFGMICKCFHEAIHQPRLTRSAGRYVSTWKEFADKMLKTPESSQALEQRGMAEAREGAAIMVPKLVWVAQKV